MSRVYSTYAGFIYDSVLSLGLAFQEIEQKHRKLLAPLGNSENLTDILVEILRNRVNFTGVTGQMLFDETGTRESNFEIWQWWDGSYNEVGLFNHVSRKLINGTQDYKWKNDRFDRSYCGLGIPCKSLKLTIAIVIGCFLTIALPLFSFFYFKWKIAEANQKYLESREEFKLARWEISPSDVEIVKSLGRGHYATVCLGTLRHDEIERTVAVKQLRRESARYLREFFYEAEILKGLNHENIVKLLGVYFDQGNFHIVMEYLENNNLNKFLITRRRLLYDNYFHTEIAPNRLTSFAKDVASALCYLARCNIVHCDIAARNVLLGPEIGGRRIAKLSDFGLSLDIRRPVNYRPRDSSAHPEMPVRLMSPETLRNKVFSFKSDIWSYGILLYEITTFGGIPYARVKDNDVIQHILDGNTLELPHDVTADFRTLIESCLQVDASERPSAESIKQTLERKPDLIRPCRDPDTNYNVESISASYPKDTDYETSIGISDRSQFPPNSSVGTITYSPLATSDYSDMRGGSTTQGNVPAGSYTAIDMVLAENYQASNSSTSPLLNGGTDYLPMSPLQNNGKSRNHARNGNTNTSLNRT